VCVVLLCSIKKMGDMFVYDEWCNKGSLTPQKIDEFRRKWLEKIRFTEHEKCFDKLDENGITREDFPIDRYGQAYDDIEKDIGRSMWWFSTDKTDAEEKQKSLSRVLLHTLKNGKGEWSYFQGLHDIASILILVLGETGAYYALTYLCKSSISLWVQKDIRSITDKVLVYVFPLLSLCDHKLYEKFQEVEALPLFCFGWILTWFTHDVEDPLAGYKLVDTLIMCEPDKAYQYVIYMCVATIELIRDGIFQMEKIDKNTIHFYFTTAMPPIVDDPLNLPLTGDGKSRSAFEKQGDRMLKVDDIIGGAYELMRKHEWKDVEGTYERLKEDKDRKDESDICNPPVCADRRTSSPKKLLIGIIVLCTAAIGFYLYATSSTTPEVPGGFDNNTF